MSISTFIKSHAVLATSVALVVVAGAVIGGRVAHRSSTEEVSSTNTKKVALVSVASFRNGGSTVAANGVVESVSQADLKAQISAPVSLVHVEIGDTVYAGQTILELQNADTRAQLQQAEASLQIAQGQYQNGSVSLDSAKQTAIDKIRDAYIKAYDAVVSQAEPILYSNNNADGRLTSLSTDTALNSEISTTDVSLRVSLRDWKSFNDMLTAATTSDVIEQGIQMAQKNLASADLLLGDMSRLMSTLSTAASPSFAAILSGWKATVSASHASVTGASQAINAAETALSSGQTSQGSTAPAQVSLAQAGVSNLQAQLAKTIIKSPISGKVSALPLREGELASPGTLVATVIGNDSGLEVKAYVSGDDISRIKIGIPALIAGAATAQSASSSQSVQIGIVSNIAPSIDALTRRAEVDIAVTDAYRAKLIIGQNIAVTLPAIAITSDSSYLLPIQDVKILPGSAYVFTIDQDSKIRRNDVILGTITGDFVQVTSGLTDDMMIVSPVYELDEGQTVIAQ